MIEALLILAAFLVAVFNTAIGPSGGVTFAVMLSVLPPGAAVPLHGLQEGLLASYRAASLRQWINWKIAVWFMAGAIVGVIVGAFLVDDLPEKTLQLVLGLFLLGLTWIPMIPFRAIAMRFALPVSVLGAASTFATLFVGATGILVMVGLEPRLKDRFSLLATHSVAMTVQHGLKIAIFGFLGFAFSQYIWLLAGMLLAGAIGTWIGRRLLDRIPETVFRVAIRILVTILAVRLILQGAQIV